MSEEIPHQILVGYPTRDHLSIRVLGRLHPDAQDFWDGNWLATTIHVAAGGFTGTVGASLRAEELQKFRAAVAELHRTLQGEAVLESMEKWLFLRIAITASGRLRVTGTLVDRAGGGTNELKFVVPELDQTFLPAMIQNLEEVQIFFPVRGSIHGS